MSGSEWLSDETLEQIASGGCCCDPSGESARCDACCAGILLSERRKLEQIRVEAASAPEDTDVPF